MKLLICDRDGVINHDSDLFIKTPDEWVAIGGAPEAIAKLTKAGWTVTVATNQSGLARGLFTPETLEAIHAKMYATVEAAGGKIDSVFFCPHGPKDNCDCRKPLPGLFYQIADHYKTDLNNAYAVGDSLRDLQAAATAGAKPCHVLTGKGASVRTGQKLPEGTLLFADLAELADWLIAQEQPA